MNIPRTTARARAFGALLGHAGMDDRWYIGKTCKRGHGENGLTVRYKKRGKCVFCDNEDQYKKRVKKARTCPKGSAVKADHLREELEIVRLEAGDLGD